MAIEPIENLPATDQVATASFLTTSKAWLGQNHLRILKFGSVGVSGVFVNLVVFEFFFRIAFASSLFTLANSIGLVVSIFTNFLLNDLWTWADRRKGTRKDWLKRLTKYYVTASLAGGVQLTLAWASLTYFWSGLALSFNGTDVSPSLSVLTGIAFGMVINFAASHLWAFRDARSE